VQSPFFLNKADTSSPL